MRLFVLFCVSVFSCAAAFSAKAADADTSMICKPSVSGNGNAYLQHVAMRDSVFDWQDKVRALYGPEWADYRTSRVKTFPCNRAGWFSQSCVVKAQPCRIDKINRS